MDINIAGSGVISAGEYDAIRISGSARSEGLVRCKSFHCSGAFSGASDIECEGDLHVSGSYSNEGSIKTGAFHVSGSAKNGAISAESVRVSGGLKVKGNIRATELKVSGGVKVKGDVEAENAHISGGITCDGLINAEELYINISGNNSSKAASIGGSRIVVECRRVSGIIGKLFGGSYGLFTVSESIEGDEISLEYTRAKTVSGRSVKIGAGCEIDLVQYTENADISPDAKVGAVEKL